PDRATIGHKAPLFLKQGPLIKSPDEDLTQDTHHNESAAKGEDSCWLRLSWIMVCPGVLAPPWHQMQIFADHDAHESR
ncbi:MAG: hypothetical protein ACREIJ_11675, partial [Nitrospiraceae bacterium]